MDRVRITVRGRVQGVGFRHFVRRRADQAGLTGWVRNQPDGSVEVEAEGARAALERLLADVRRGPSGARVATCDEAWSEGPPRYRGFQVTG